MTLLRGALPQLREDPKPLLALVESSWPDVRAESVALPREVDLARFGLDGLMGRVDSSHPEVQDLGKELIRSRLGELPHDELLFRLSQHPHKNVRRFALELMEAQLKQGFVTLTRLELFFRAALLEYWPDRELKTRAVNLLTQRALADEHQAELAAGILRDVVRTATRSIFELVARALVRIRLAFPQVETELKPTGGAA